MPSAWVASEEGSWSRSYNVGIATTSDLALYDMFQTPS